mmetsp:Transcript_18898/g.32516  ORF Transcript_18898/g.32516 Transcript_18898/m.32516 type:complete len:117 (-) Transcript_18898:383-733(-)
MSLPHQHFSSNEIKTLYGEFGREISIMGHQIPDTGRIQIANCKSSSNRTFYSVKQLADRNYSYSCCELNPLTKNELLRLRHAHAPATGCDCVTTGQILIICKIILGSIAVSAEPNT